jgi:hypothetical protein
MLSVWADSHFCLSPHTASCGQIRKSAHISILYGLTTDLGSNGNNNIAILPSVSALTLYPPHIYYYTSYYEAQGQQEQGVHKGEMKKMLHGEKHNTEQNEAETEVFKCKNHKNKLKTVQRYEKFSILNSQFSNI